MRNAKNQVKFLVDKSASGRVRPWDKKKQASCTMASGYDHVNERKAERMRECAQYLDFVKEDGKLKLHHMNSCRVRLCPMCAWRRSLKVYNQVSRIMQEIRSSKRKISYIFLTLTVRNCEGKDLDSTLKHMLLSWNQMTRYKAFEDMSIGWFRGLEITHNTDINSQSYDTYHPHIHAIIAVSSRYFTGKKYISQEGFTKLWRKALKVDYDPIVHVEKVKGYTAKAVAEVAKYTVKESDIINTETMIDTIETLDKAIANKRLVAFGGLFKELHKKLNLDDVIDGDLVHVEGDNVSHKDEEPHVVFFWNPGWARYVMYSDGRDEQ